MTGLCFALAHVLDWFLLRVGVLPQNSISRPHWFQHFLSSGLGCIKTRLQLSCMLPYILHFLPMVRIPVVDSLR